MLRMTDDRGPLRSISWRDIFPWLVIFRTFGLAVSWPLLLVATLGVLVTPLGWNAAHLLFVSDEPVATSEAHVDRNKADVDDERPQAEPDEDLQALAKKETLRKESAFREFVNFNDRWPGQEAYRASTPGRLPMPYPANVALFTSGEHKPDAESVFQRFISPFRELFSRTWSVRQIAYFLFGGLWTLLVWSFCGGAITRIAALHLGREERVGLREASWFALRKLGAYFSAPLLPLIAVVVLAALIAMPSLLARFDFGVIVSGLFWILALLASFVMAILLLGLMFGWPLMWCTVSVEGTDPFDALARAYAYVFQRPLHYLFYGLLAAFFGALGYALVFYFSESVIHLAYWAASWGTGAERMDEIVKWVSQPERIEDRTVWFGAELIGLSVGLVRCIAVAFSFSFFWCLATAIYLLLRQNVDQTEFDEVFLEDGDEPYGLPPLKPDKHGGQVVPIQPAPPTPTPMGAPVGQTSLPPSSAPADANDGE